MGKENDLKFNYSSENMEAVDETESKDVKKTLGFLLEPVDTVGNEKLVVEGICSSCVTVSGCVTCLASW